MTLMERAGGDLGWARDLTLSQVREHVVAAGGPPADVDAGRDALADPTQWFHGLAMVAARGRRPD